MKSSSQTRDFVCNKFFFLLAFWQCLQLSRRLYDFGTDVMIVLYGSGG